MKAYFVCGVSAAANVSVGNVATGAVLGGLALVLFVASWFEKPSRY
jgi:hypothetical protein